MSDTRTFMGMTIEGEVGRFTPRPAQRPAEELLPYVNNLLAFDEIAGVKWTQYTPYFNDGDACVFSANGPMLTLTEDADKTAEDDEEQEEYAYDDRVWISDYSEKFLSLVPEYDWVGKWPDRVKVYREGTGNRDLAEAYDALEALESGAFDDVLQEHFGEHSMVHFYKGSDKIRVDFYEHD
jgi:hypothetical protein